MIYIIKFNNKSKINRMNLKLMKNKLGIHYKSITNFDYYKKSLNGKIMIKLVRWKNIVAYLGSKMSN